MLRAINIIKSNKGSTLYGSHHIVGIINTNYTLFISMSNTKQAAYQANNIQAYYIAYSGVEALMQHFHRYFKVAGGQKRSIKSLDLKR